MPKLTTKKKTKKPRRNPQSLLFGRKRFTRFTVVTVEDPDVGSGGELSEREKLRRAGRGYSKIFARAAKKKDKTPKGTGSTGPRIRTQR